MSDYEMDAYEKWIDKEHKKGNRGLGLRDAFDAGQRAMLEKLRNDLVQPSLDDKTPRNNGMIRAILDMHEDQLVKEAGNE